MSRCIVSAGVFALLLMGGCGSTSQSSAQADTAPVPAASTDVARLAAKQREAGLPTTQPAETHEPITTPEALAWKTSAHVRELEDQLNRRPKPALVEAAPVKVASSQPAAVQWAEPAKTQPVAKIDPPTPPATSPAGISLVQVKPTTAPTLASITELAVQPTPPVKSDPPVQPITLPPKAVVVTTDQFEDKLKQQVKDYPRDLAGQLEYQVLQWVRGRQVPQMDVIAGLPAEDREILSALMDTLSNFRNNVRGNDNLLLAQKVRPFVEMADRLRPQASLRVPTVALCQRVQGFGVYDPLEANHFTAGRNNKVIVYCEVENFASFLNDHRMWQTDLAQETIVYDDRGQRVWVEKRQAFKDLTRNRRQDFCVAREIRLPASLKPGTYSVTVSIADQQANRMAEATIPIQVIARVEAKPTTRPTSLESLLLRQ